MTIEQQDLVEVVSSIWECVLGVNLAPAVTPPAWSCRERLLGTISISGEWTGVVVVETAVAVARQAACTMFSLAEADVSRDDVRDALSEMTNIVGGNLKSLVPGPSSLALPAVTSGDDYDFRLAGASLISTATFLAEGHPLRIGVWEKIPEAALV